MAAVTVILLQTRSKKLSGGASKLNYLRFYHIPLMVYVNICMRDNRAHKQHAAMQPQGQQRRGGGGGTQCVASFDGRVMRELLQKSGVPELRQPSVVICSVAGGGFRALVMVRGDRCGSVFHLTTHPSPSGHSRHDVHCSASRKPHIIMNTCINKHKQTTIMTACDDTLGPSRPLLATDFTVLQLETTNQMD